MVKKKFDILKMTTSEIEPIYAKHKEIIKKSILAMKVQAGSDFKNDKDRRNYIRSETRNIKREHLTKCFIELLMQLDKEGSGRYLPTHRLVTACRLREDRVRGIMQHAINRLLANEHLCVSNSPGIGYRIAQGSDVGIEPVKRVIFGAGKFTRGLAIATDSTASQENISAETHELLMNLRKSIAAVLPGLHTMAQTFKHHPGASKILMQLDKIKAVIDAKGLDADEIIPVREKDDMDELDA